MIYVKNKLKQEVVVDPWTAVLSIPASDSSVQRLQNSSENSRC